MNSLNCHSSRISLQDCILYYLSKITLTRYLLFYILISIIFFYPVMPRVFPGISTFVYFLRLFFLVTFLAAYLVDLATVKIFSVPMSRTMACMYLYILSAFFSLALQSSSAHYTDALRELFYTLFSFIAGLTAISLFSRKEIPAVGTVFILIATASVLASFVQMYLGRADITRMHISSLFPDRNMFARFLSITHSFVLIRYLARPKRDIICRDTLLLLLILACVTLLFSRSGYILYSLSTFIILWKVQNRRLKRVGVIIGLLVLGVFSAMTYKRVKTDYMDIVNSSDMARVSAMAAGKNIIKRHPLTGIGYGMARYRYHEFEEKSLYGIPGVKTIHNVFVNVFAEQGIVGLALYLLYNFGILFSLIQRGALTRSIREHRSEFFCFTALSLYMIHGLVYHSFDSEGFYWIIVATSIIVLREPGSASTPDATC